MLWSKNSKFVFGVFIYPCMHCALIEIAHCRSYKNDFGFCPFLSRLFRVNHIHDPPKTQVWSCSLALKGSKTSPWFEIYCQWKGNSCTAPTAALQSAQWCIFIDLVWWQCEFTLFTLLHDMNMVQGVLTLCEFHYCDFSRLLRKILLMRFGLFYLITAIFGLFGVQNEIK